MKADKLIIGVLGGVAVGALLGVLFAPEKGSKTRQNILDKSGDYADELKDKFDVLLGSLTQKYENIWQQGENLIAEGKSKFYDAKDESENMIAQGKSEFNNAKKEINDLNL